MLVGLASIAMIAYWYTSQNNMFEISTEETATTTAANKVKRAETGIPGKDTMEANAMEFDPANVDIGEKFGAFTVAYSGYWSGDKTYSIKFKGPLVIHGVLTDTGLSMCGPILQVSPSMSEKLPRVRGAKVGSAEFYLDLQKLPDGEQLTHNGTSFTNRSGIIFQEGDTLEVVVDTLWKSYQGKDCSGNRIEVVSLKKISI